MFCIRAIAAESLLFDSVPSRSSTSIHELALRRPLSNGDGCDSPRVAKAMTRVRPVLHDWSIDKSNQRQIARKLYGDLFNARHIESLIHQSQEGNTCRYV